MTVNIHKERQLWVQIVLSVTSDCVFSAQIFIVLYLLPCERSQHFLKYNIIFSEIITCTCMILSAVYFEFQMIYF